jgi:hypothetical protein
MCSTETAVTIYNDGVGAVYPCGAFFSRLAIALSVLPRFTTSDYAIGLINNNKKHIRTASYEKEASMTEGR